MKSYFILFSTPWGADVKTISRSLVIEVMDRLSKFANLALFDPNIPYSERDAIDESRALMRGAAKNEIWVHGSRLRPLMLPQT